MLNLKETHEKQSIWWRALKWLGWDILGTLVPVWASILLFALFSSGFELGYVANKGEIYIYGVSFLVPIIFSRSTYRTRAKTLILRISIVLLFFAGVLYAGILVLSLPGHKLDLLVNTQFLYVSSFTVFILSIIFSYLNNIFEYKQQTIESVEASRAEELETLKKKFKALQGEQVDE